MAKKRSKRSKSSPAPRRYTSRVVAIYKPPRLQARAKTTRTNIIKTALGRVHVIDQSKNVKQTKPTSPRRSLSGSLATPQARRIKTRCEHAQDTRRHHYFKHKALGGSRNPTRRNHQRCK